MRMERNDPKTPLEICGLVFLVYYVISLPHGITSHAYDIDVFYDHVVWLEIVLVSAHIYHKLRVMMKNVRDKSR